MLELQNLCVKRGQRTIFSGINGQIKSGELVALVGENGAGKSTLLHAIAGSIDYQGDILLHDENIEQYDESELATKRAVLAQSHSTSFGFGIPELIAMGRHMMAEPLAECYKQVNRYIELLELNHLLNRSTQQLSGGELQRVYFAKCLAQLNAFSDQKTLAEQNTETVQKIESLMLLDEPTSALDLRHQHRLLQLVKNFTVDGGAAIVAIHDLNLAALYADKVLLIHEGKLHAYGTPEQVFTLETLEEVYQTPMHVSKHPTQNYPMIFSEPKEVTYENSSIS